MILKLSSDLLLRLIQRLILWRTYRLERGRFRGSFANVCTGKVFRDIVSVTCSRLFFDSFVAFHGLTFCGLCLKSLTVASSYFGPLISQGCLVAQQLDCFVLASSSAPFA